MDPRLHEYITEQRKRGVSDSAIKLMLLRSGFSPAVIDAALTPHTQKPHHFPVTLFLIGFIVVLIALSFLYYVTFLKPAPSYLLDLNTEPLEVNVQPGEDLSFIKEISSMGSAKRYDIMLTHAILNPRTGEAITSKTETIAIETKGSSKTTLAIPEEFSPGYYLLQTKAEYEGNVAIASFLFKVYQKGPEPSCFDNEQNQEEEGVDCGGPCNACDHCDNSIVDGDEEGIDCGGSCIPCVRASCFDSILNQDEEEVDCGGVCMPCSTGTCYDGKKNQNEEGVDCGGICRACTLGDRSFAELDPKEQLIKARETAKDDPALALKLCKTVDDQTQKDECIAQVADEANDKAMCASILIPSKRDSCLLSFALEGDYTVCSEITNIYLMNSCLNLEKSAVKKELSQ